MSTNHVISWNWSFILSSWLIFSLSLEWKSSSMHTVDVQNFIDFLKCLYVELTMQFYRENERGKSWSWPIHGFIVVFVARKKRTFMDTYKGQKICAWWYIHNIPRTGVAPSTCRRKLDALRENLTVCQLLSFKTPCPANKFCEWKWRKIKLNA